MPRHSRLDIAGVPQLVLQRGTDDRPIFRCGEDRRQYLMKLQISSTRYACSVHAYALLPNEVCLLATGAMPRAVSRMMQSLGRRYAHYANARDQTEGGFWCGRYRSCPVGGEEHVVRAMCYVDGCPVRVGMVDEVGACEWSSHACHAEGIVVPGLVSHPAYAALGTNGPTRRSKYRALLAACAADAEEILLHIEQGRAWGNERFVQEIAAQFGGCGPARPRGRPRKAKLKAPIFSLATVSPFLLTASIAIMQTAALQM